MKFKIKIAVIAMMGMSLRVNAQNEYPVIQPTIKINNSPWYGLGRSNLTMPNSNYESVQLAGYYGLLFKTAGGEFTLHQNGIVGIGTTSPYSKLQVEGRTSVGKSGVLNLDWTYQTNWGGSSYKWAGYIGFNAYRNNDDTKDNYYGRNRYTSKGVFEGSNYGFRWLYRNRINNDSNVQHQLNEYMRLDNNGNLGIGTTNTKGFKLGVNGKIAATEVKVATYANWADFVFNKDYKLPSLKEVENHIKETGHLKDIPNAEEVKKDGFYLAEMNAKLLQKIEELTLYTIDQEKRIKSLEAKNDKLVELLEKLIKEKIEK